MIPKLVRGTPVVSLADGATLGVVDHVYFDPQHLAVVGFTFHQRAGLFGGGSSGLIDVADVHAFGPDAITVDDVSAVRSELAIAAATADLVELAALVGRAVVTEGGRQLGRVAEIIFDEGSHQLLTLALAADDDDRRRVAAGDVVTIGTELIVVRERAAQVVTLRPTRVRLAPPERTDQADALPTEDGHAAAP